MIELSNGYYIETNPYGYTLFKNVERTKKQTGDKYIAQEVKGYYTSLTSALNAYLDKCAYEFVSNNEKVQIGELIDVVNQTKQEILNISKID